MILLLLNMWFRTRLLMRVIQHHNAVKQQSSDCRRVKWCPCMVDDDDDDDDVSADDVGKLLAVTDSRTVSSLITLGHFK